MEKDERSQRTCKKIDSELFLQWGNRKRLRCVRVKDSQNTSHKSNATTRRRFNSSTFSHSNYRPTSSEASILQSTMTEHQKTLSLEKEDRYYTTRGSAVSLIDENGKVVVDSNGDDKKRVVWPKLYMTLSSKEKEEDFMAMKGCKPPQRPRKRAKIIQRSLLLVSPGAWLTDMCQERYEVREKKSYKKRPRGLKAMGSMESYSD
ncbi:hypothetical protein ES332_A13G122600v1 [Gossypium tomentosum]|uniref:DUF1639 domain-containing protein n=1 Tax=Gossypium tomentosum TaxID=34277 RepID=A0A5D2MJ62_GOSTO|nr:hypothetical protein ES332_A13G122600v1 [Gossypium tomentosum]TYH91537.1 hypothetical protein ES332_A13G122600v1 [Gossypium tomentosum]TYH91538.1 hypothetical protein ES332_A13G122600v1 [Gossypium tomentosum]